MKTVRFGFIGTGKISLSSGTQVSTHPQAEVTACQDLSQERREAFAGQFGATAYEQVSDLLADDSVDAVSIAVPNKFHASLAIEAMRAGKHVLLEKPFAMNAGEAEEVIRVAEETGKTFLLGMNQRYAPESQKAKHLAKKGMLGDIYHGKAYWFRRSGIPRLGTWFGSKELAGAGAINDIGVHMLDLCLHLMDNFEPVSVFGTTYTQFGNRGLGEGGWGASDREKITFDVDDFAAAHIRMKNGATITLEVAWACHTRSHNKVNVELFGTDAGVSVFPLELYQTGSEGSEYQILEEPVSDIALPHANKFHNFINHLTEGEPLLTTAQQALAVQKILDAVSESSRTGQSVSI